MSRASRVSRARRRSRAANEAVRIGVLAWMRAGLKALNGYGSPLAELIVEHAYGRAFRARAALTARITVRVWLDYTTLACSLAAVFSGVFGGLIAVWILR